MKFNYQKFIYYFLWILGLSVIQSTLLQHISIFNVMPNLLVIFVIIAAIMSGSSLESAIVGVISGFLLDFMIGRTIGVNMLLLMYIGVFTGLLFKRILTRKYFGILATVFVTSLIYCFFYYVMNFTMWGQGNLLYAFTWVMLVETVYNTIICVPIFLLARKGYRKIS